VAAVHNKFYRLGEKMILATLNLSNGEWAVAEDGDSSSVAVGFTSDTTPTTFDGLSFGWALSVAGEEVASASYPEGDIVYVSTDQQYMATDAIAADPDDECSLTVWAENAGDLSEITHEWIVARPESPYESWEWDAEAKAWQAPVPMPEDEEMYVWNEDSGSWDVASEKQD